MVFRLHDGAGTQVGDAITETVVISDGLFTQPLDFGADAFTGDARWLDIQVMCPDDAGFADLGRQELTAAPYALYASAAGDADLLDGQEGTDYQRRVSDACAVGSTVRAINADGSVVCQVDAPLNRPAPPATNTLSAVDTEGNVGEYTSITIGTDGLGLISYRDTTNNDLNVAHCDNLACTSATLSTVDSAGSVGAHGAMIIGADGLGLISYYAGSPNGDLRVAHCDDIACTSATISTLDTAGNVGKHTSVAIGADGLGLISYYADGTNGDLRVAHCDNIACTSATTTTLDITGIVGEYTSITIGADGLGLISYRDTTNDDLKVAHCDNLACTSATLSTIDSAGSVGAYNSITIGADGLGLISYYDYANYDLRVAHCNDLACTGAITTTLDTAGIVGQYTSITIGADGLGLISYYDYVNYDLRVAHCSDLACTGAITTTLDTAGIVGQHTSITVGTDGLGLISYYDQTDNDLKVAHCANAFCVPYFRRR
jgi:hypothetical protein